MDEGELRQAMTALDTYRKQIDNIGQQAQLLQRSLEDMVKARETLEAVKNAKEGDEVLLPIGAASFINVKMTANTKAIVGIGSRTSVEMSPENAKAYIEDASKECSATLKDAIDAMGEIQKAAEDLRKAIQKEYDKQDL